MSRPPDELEKVIAPLVERAKELECLYRIDEILSSLAAPEDEVLRKTALTIPTGWQHPRICGARIIVGKSVYATAGFAETPWMIEAAIVPDEEPVGVVQVCYFEARPTLYEGPFLYEERRLIDNIAKRIDLFLLQRRLRAAHAGITGALRQHSREKPAWRVVLDFLVHSDHELLHRINRRMINHLCWTGVPGAAVLLASLSVEDAPDHERLGENAPLSRRPEAPNVDVIEQAFALAGEYLAEQEILRLINGWINEEKSLFLVQSLENAECGLSETGEALRRFAASGLSDAELPQAVRMTLRVGLIRRYLLDQPDFIRTAKEHIAVADMQEITDRLVYPSNSHGRLGGKGARLFLAHRILMGLDDDGLLENVRVPKTWYVVSDGILAFIHYNRLEEVYNRKYLDLERVRQEYPNIIRVFKCSAFPPEMSKQLGAALDDFGDQPIIVRSSSLLEDQTGASFAGKYKSLFLANQGSKRERLAALQDAIAEIYASVFGPDPIEYRAERGLLEVNEEMGVLIQGVVGRRFGRWFAPAFAGVAFGSNEFRWSPRIKREDGLIRLVPGLGTRAVDRTSDDYPVLIAPGQPTLRVNASSEEIERYAPRKMDVIDLESNSFATVDAADLLRRHGNDTPGARQMISMLTSGVARPSSGLEPDWGKDRFVVTFEGMLSRTPFMRQMHRMLSGLREALGWDVDLEFAGDGEHLYLLQCRPQSRSGSFAPAPIPRDIPRERLLFATDRDVSNGVVSGITHVVYVDPDAYDSLPELRLKKETARVVGRLNSILPRHRFILMGPGRWGSRGDINLGVPVTYSEISNASMLIEIAKASGSYVPELSFGTHFFQDMVEAGIRYLPLYPGTPGCVLNEGFLAAARNRLPELLPAAGALERVVRVVDVAGESGGRTLRVLMNADLMRAVGVLDDPGAASEVDEQRPAWTEDGSTQEHWRWRFAMADRIAEVLDRDRYGVRGVYLIGGVRNADAGPESDIDLLIHDSGDRAQRDALTVWLAGWSRALAAFNELRTGCRAEGLLDVRFVTDEELESPTGPAGPMRAAMDGAWPLPRNSPAQGEASG